MVSTNGVQPAVFDGGSATPAKAVSKISLPSLALNTDDVALWDGVRDSGILPTFGSDLRASTGDRQEFLAGARMMGLIGGQKSLKPQQLRMVDTLNAGRRFSGVLLPRRSAKTTTILAWMLGRCSSRPGYLAAYTMATTGKKARERFKKDIVPVLSRAYPDKRTRPFRIYEGNGDERIVFDNGAIFQVLGPSAESFRSDAWDLIVVDEGGEADPETGVDLVTGALPTQDTQPGAQFVVAGTAAEYRAGNMLWDELEKGRAGHPDHAIIDYSAAESVSADDLADWDIVAALVLEHHPGIGTLTTLEVIRVNWENLPRQKFAREYLSIFGLVGLSGGLLDMEAWQCGGTDEPLPSPPERFALVIASHPDQISASIVAVWREPAAGTACILVLDHRPGVQWLAAEALRLARAYKAAIVHDSRGTVTVEVEQLQRARPRPMLSPQTTRNVTTAAALLVKEVADGRVRHWNQDTLTAAAQSVTKRRILGTWGLGRQNETDDITDVEAAALGLRAYDEGVISRPKLTVVI